MDFRIRIVGMICLFLFYIIQCALIASPLFRETLLDDNEQSYLGFFGVDILLILVTFVYLLLKWMGLALIDRLIVLFDSFLFAFSFAWMVLAAPVANDVAGFFIINFLVATGIFFLDMCEFRQFSHAYQRNRSSSNAVNEEMHMNEMHAGHDGDIENQTTSTALSTGTCSHPKVLESDSYTLLTRDRFYYYLQTQKVRTAEGCRKKRCTGVWPSAAAPTPEKSSTCRTTSISTRKVIKTYFLS